jgi:hypothetical protein
MSVLEKLGECQIKVGRIVDGTESLRRVLREPLGPDAPPAYTTAKEQAQRELDAASHRVARVNIAVAAPAGVTPWVKIDGAPMSVASLNTDRPIDPGDHTIEAGALGYLTATSTVHSKEGGTEPVALTLVVDPNAPVATIAAPPVVLPAPVASPPVAPVEAARPAKSHALAYVVGGAGLAGLVVGAAGGIAAVIDKGNLTSACHGNVCPPSSQSTLNAGTTAGTVSTIGFIAGGALLGAGIALYFVDFGGPSGPEHATARAYVGPSSLGIAGSF